MRIRGWIVVLLSALVLALPAVAEEPATDAGSEAAGEEATPPVDTEPPAPEGGESDEAGDAE